MSGNVQAMLFLLNRPEPIRQSSLLMVLATGLGDSHALLSGLDALASESSPPWSDRVRQLKTLLEQGQTLSEALSSAPGVLPEESVVAIRVAEETGTLKQVLAEEAHRLMNAGEFGSPVQATLPATLSWFVAVTLVANALVSFIMMFIIPKFKKIFADFGTDLPDMTEMLVSMSDWMLQYWYFVALPIITFIALPCWWIFKFQFEYISSGRLRIAEYLPRYLAPLVLRLMSVTVATGSSLNNGLHAILKELRPSRSSERLSGVRQQVSAGMDCWEAMRQYGFINQREVQFLRASERTNHLDWGLLHLSRNLDRRRARWTQRIIGFLQPAMVLFVGFMVGFVCIALFLPLIKLVNDLS